MKSRTEEVRMSRNLYRIVRHQDGSFEYCPILVCWQICRYGMGVTPDSPLSLFRLGLPDDLEEAISILQQAKQRDAGSLKVERALAVLRRYIDAFEKQQFSRQAGREQAAKSRSMTPEEVLEAFKLATRFHEEDPRLSRTAILDKVATALNARRARTEAMSRKKLEREGVRPLMPGEESHT